MTVADDEHGQGAEPGPLPARRFDSETGAVAADLAPRTAEPRARKRWPWFAAAGAVVLAGAGIGIAAALGAFAPAPEPVAERPATTAPASPAPTTPAPAPPREPLTTSIPSVQQMPYTEVWNPPDGGQYFWQIVDLANGYPQTGGTTYVLAHACENQSCAGDQLRSLEAGDTIDYLGQAYRVQESREILKTDIAAQDIWYHDPNRLVVITCVIETTWDQSDKNDIVIATKL